jgi:hypothetical protein
MAVPWSVPIFRLVTEEHFITYCRHYFSGDELDALEHLIHTSGAVIER